MMVKILVLTSGRFGNGGYRLLTSPGWNQIKQVNPLVISHLLGLGRKADWRNNELSRHPVSAALSVEPFPGPNQLWHRDTTFLRRQNLLCPSGNASSGADRLEKKNACCSGGTARTARCFACHAGSS